MRYLKTVFLPLTLSLIVLFFSQIFFLILGASSYTDFKTDARIAANELCVTFTAEKLSIIKRLGRDIEQYPNLDQIINELSIATKSKIVAITDADGKILASNHKESEKINTLLIENNTYKSGEELFSAIPYYGADNALSGYILSSSSYAKQFNYNEFKLSGHFYTALGIGLIASIVIFCVLFLYEINKTRRSKSKSFSKIRAFILPFCLVQAISLIFIAPSLSSEINRNFNLFELTAATSIKNQINSVINLGVNFDDISNLDSYINGIKNKINEIESISITDIKKHEIAGDSVAANAGTRLPLISNSGTVGFVNLKLKDSVFYNLISKLAIDAFTVIIVSLIFIYELSSLMGSEINQQRQNNTSDKEKPFCDPGVIRPLAFLSICAVYMPFSVIPVYMLTLVGDSFSFAPNIIMSLPITTDICAVGISTVLVLLFSRRVGGWRQLIRLGLAFIAVSFLIAFITDNAYVFLFSRILYGLGYGTLLLSFDMYVIKNSDKSSRGKHLAAMSAGLFSGCIGGCAAGGMIADHFGIKYVFLGSFFIIICTLLIVLYIIYKKQDAVTVTENKKPFNLKSVPKFLSDKQVLSAFILQILPYGAIAVGTFNYFLPVSMHNSGYSASTVGQLNLIYSLTVILTAPFFGKLLDKAHDKYFILGMGLIFSALSPLMFSLPYPLFGAILALFFLGLSAGINESGQITYISGLKISKQIGENEAVTMLDIFVRLGQFIGPMLIALTTTYLGTYALIYISAITLLFAILFIVCQKIIKGNMQTKCPLNN